MSRGERFTGSKRKKTPERFTPDADITKLLDQRFGQPAAEPQRFTRALPETTRPPVRSPAPEPEAFHSAPPRRTAEPATTRMTPSLEASPSTWDQPARTRDLPPSLRAFDSNGNGDLEDDEHLEAMDHGAYKKPSPRLQQLLVQFEELGFDPDELQEELSIHADEEERIETAQNAILNGMLEKIEQSGQDVDALQAKVEELDDFEESVALLEQHLANQSGTSSETKKPRRNESSSKKRLPPLRKIITIGGGTLLASALAFGGYSLVSQRSDASPTPNTEPTAMPDSAFPTAQPSPEVLRTSPTIESNPIPPELQHNVQAFINRLGPELTIAPGDTVSLLTETDLVTEQAWREDFIEVNGFFGRGPFVPITLISQAAAQTDGRITVHALPLINPPAEYLAIFQSDNPTLSSIQLPADHDLSQDATITNTSQQSQTIKIEYHPDNTVSVTIAANTP